jgi:O-antigen ligase
MAVGAVATLGSVAAALLVLGRAGPVERERCAHRLTGVGAVLAGTAWLGVAWRLPRFADLVDSRLWRGAGTLTYPNAAAALLVPLALLAIAMRAGTGRRWVGGAVSYLLLVGVGAALSRAGLIALVVGLVVLVALTGIRTTLRAAAAPLLGALVAIAALAPSFPASDQPRPWLAVAGLLGGAVLAIGPELLPDRVRGIAVGAAWVLCGVGLWTLRGGPALHQIAASRGNLDSSGRSGAIQAALHLVAQRPLVGTGIGQARFLWATPDGNGQIALYVHNEYLQTLVDLGAIGAALLLLLFIAIAVTIHRGRAFGHRPGIRAGALAALAAFAVHSGVDFLWHIAVLPLAAGLFIGLAATGAGLTAIGGTTTSTSTEGNQQ